MIQLLALISTPILNLPVIRRIRRNHGLEHATIHVLSQRVKNLSMAGRSTATGFYLYGNITTGEVEAAAWEALRRMDEACDVLIVEGIGSAAPDARRRVRPRDPSQLRHRVGNGGIPDQHHDSAWHCRDAQ